MCQVRRRGRQFSIYGPIVADVTAGVCGDNLRRRKTLRVSPCQQASYGGRPGKPEATCAGITYSWHLHATATARKPYYILSSAKRDRRRKKWVTSALSVARSIALAVSVTRGGEEEGAWVEEKSNGRASERRSLACITISATKLSSKQPAEKQCRPGMRSDAARRNAGFEECGRSRCPLPLSLDVAGIAGRDLVSR